MTSNSKQAVGNLDSSVSTVVHREMQAEIMQERFSRRHIAGILHNSLRKLEELSPTPDVIYPRSDINRRGLPAE